MPNDSPATVLTRRFVEKREAILDAAAQLFNRKRVKGATLFDVGEKVGLSTNSITYYYRKKEDLVVACLLRAIEEIKGIAITAGKAATPEQRVRQFITLFFERLAMTATGLRPELMSFREIRALPDAHAEVVFSAYTEMFRRIRDLLQTRAPETRLERSSLSARAHLLLSLPIGAMSWISRYEPQDYPLVAESGLSPKYRYRPEADLPELQTSSRRTICSSSKYLSPTRIALGSRPKDSNPRE